MKIKLNFDKNAVKEFLLEHVEKFVFAGILLAFLSLVTGAIWAGRYERSPENLIESVERAEKDIDAIPHVSAREMTPVADTIRGYRAPQEGDYRHDKRWIPRLINPMGLREEPPVLLVRELRGSSGYGAFNLRIHRDGAADPRGRPATRDVAQGRRGQRWAVITGLVPVREQVQAFEEFFRDRIKPNPEPDVPEYIYYRVERAEVDPYVSPSDPDQLKWTTLNLRAALAATEKTWSATAPEVVDERFLHPQLVFPLGPKVVEERDRAAMYPGEEAGLWGEEVAHPPQIPLKQRHLEDEPDPEDSAEPGPDDPWDGPIRGEGGAGYPRTTPGARRPAPPRFMEGEGMRRPGVGMGDYAGEEMGLYDRTPDYLLFRFFDYTVQPGKSYRYRVRLMLANPNFKLDPKYLADPELAKRQWIEKDRWSEPTPVITVPRDAHVLAGGVHTLIRETDDPSGTVAIVKWREETGEEVHKDFRVTRGQLLDYPGTVIRDPRRTREPVADARLLDPRKDVREEEPEKVDFVTGILALDLKGGSRLPGRDRSMTEPGRILVVDEDGTLRTLSEAQDKREYERRTVEPETPETDMPGMMHDPMMDDMMLLEGMPPPRGRRP